MTDSTAEKYRDSGIEWVGPIPPHWEVKPLKFCCRENDQLNSNAEERNVLSLSYGRVVPRDIESNFGLLPESFSGYQIVEPGYLVLRLTDLQNDKRSLRVGHVSEKGIITSAYIGLVPNDEINSRFAFYLLHSYDLTKVFYGLGGGVRQSMKFEDLSRLPLLLPPLHAQLAIAKFLDRKTAAIDALIEKKRKLVQLLAEKRAALINCAVTKGLDPTVPMKDSGIPWIGEIPAHWEVKKTRFLCSRIKTGATPPTNEVDLYSDGIIPWYAPGSFDSDTLHLSDPKALLNERVWKANVVPKFRNGSVLIVGIGATLGKVAHLDIEATANQQVLALEFNPAVMDSRFAAYQYKYRESVFRDRALYTTLPIMNQDGIAEHHAICPNIDEQKAIVVHIEAKLKRMDKTKSLVVKQITHLQEYRQALITAAVTGQLEIPVDESAPKEAQT